MDNSFVIERVYLGVETVSCREPISLLFLSSVAMVAMMDMD